MAGHHLQQQLDTSTWIGERGDLKDKVTPQVTAQVTARHVLPILLYGDESADAGRDVFAVSGV